MEKDGVCEKFLEAKKVLREAEVGDPMNLSLTRSLADLYFSESEFLTESGYLPQAAKCLEHALSRFEKLAKVDSKMKQKLGKCYMNLASIQAELGAFQKAEESYLQAMFTFQAVSQNQENDDLA